MFDKITALLTLVLGAYLVCLGAFPRVQEFTIRLLTREQSTGPFDLEVAVVLAGLWAIYSGAQMLRGNK